MAYGRRAPRRAASRTTRRASPRNYGSKRRTAVNSVRGRRASAPARAQTLRIVIEQPGATLARPDLPTEGTPRAARNRRL